MYCFRGKLNFIENFEYNLSSKNLRRLHFIGAIEKRFIAKLYVFDQKEDEDSIESFIARLKSKEPSSSFCCFFTAIFLVFQIQVQSIGH